MPKGNTIYSIAKSFLSPFGTGGYFSRVLILEFSDDSGSDTDSDEPKGLTSLTPFLERKGLDFSDTSKVAVRNFDVL